MISALIWCINHYQLCKQVSAVSRHQYHICRWCSHFMLALLAVMDLHTFTVTGESEARHLFFLYCRSHLSAILQPFFSHFSVIFWPSFNTIFNQLSGVFQSASDIHSFQPSFHHLLLSHFSHHLNVWKYLSEVYLSSSHIPRIVGAINTLVILHPSPLTASLSIPLHFTTNF